MGVHQPVFSAEEANVAENFAKGRFESFWDFIHQATKSTDVLLAKAGRVLDSREFSSKVPDFSFGTYVVIFSLEGDLFCDLVIVNPNAVGRHY